MEEKKTKTAKKIDMLSAIEQIVEKAKDSKDKLEIASLWPAQEFPKSTGQLTANLWAKSPALFDDGSCILALKKQRDPPSIWGKKTKAQAHKSHLSV